MQFFNRSSIRKTLQLVLLTVSSAALLMAIIGFAINDWYVSKQQLYSQLRSEASIIANNSIAALTFGDLESAQRTIASLRNENNIIAAALYSSDSTLFAKFENKPGYLPLKPLSNGQGEYQGLLYQQLAIALDQDNIGSILLLADLSQWRHQQYDRLLTVFSLFILALLGALFIASRLQNFVTQPLISLAKTVRTITKSKDYRLRAQVLSKDEIGLLASDFNQMLDQIQLRDESLRLAQEQLEEKVKERTQELQILTKELQHQAHHDALTGLANRTHFDERLRTSIAGVNDTGAGFSVMFLDLDRFKMVNDTLGHDVGDALLVAIAQRLKACLGAEDTLARLGGDEFAVLLNDANHAHTQTIATQLLTQVCNPVEVNGYNLQMSTSIGVAMVPKDGSDVATILKNADTAMYHSKESGRNRVTFFNQDMNLRLERRLLLENHLRDAIEQKQLSVHYQAKWSCAEHRLIGVEALVRWFHPTLGEVSPEEFVPLAEECGVIVDIDRYVMNYACQDLLALHTMGFTDLQLSVNFSPRHFSQPDTAKAVAEILHTTGFPGARLELEITESLLGPDTEDIYEQLQAIHALGVEISIDDFGRAYSSLSRIKQLPLHTLKIDRDFIRDLGQDADDETLVVTIITMAHNLNLKVVAEGIETEAQYRFVVENNCDLVQGFLFSRPVEFSQLLGLVKQPGAVRG
ncbi:bifunctional diguanylate cyclase/phosphodiesterase [Halioxenophilus aromaticivorans]|uniref:GGDEF domain-containing protein n=1 Tax=Halioxenophilus aromaticivorans TaxID=1306992 RepID=A0AAV3U9C8_9ALTE